MIDYLQMRLIDRSGADLITLYADNRRRVQTCTQDEVLSSKNIPATSPAGVAYMHYNEAARSGFELKASPAKIGTGGHNVFADGPADEHDLKACALMLLGHMPDLNGTPFSERYPLELWELRRVDVTFNLAFPSERHVNREFQRLRTIPIRERLPYSRSNSLTWQPSSKRSGLLVYRKGREAKQHNRRAELDDHLTAYTPRQLELSKLLLRLEARFKAEWCNTHGFEASASTLIEAWKEITTPMTDSTKYQAEYDQVRDLVYGAHQPNKAAPIFTTWRLITSEGYELCRHRHERQTFYRHCRALKELGITDLQTWAGHHKRIDDEGAPFMTTGRLVTSWEELETYADEVSAA